MPFAALDAAAVARALSQIADRDEDRVDAFFERSEEVTLPPDDEPPGMRVRREEGLAVRLVRDGRTWLASRDGVEPGEFSDALRQVARALPAAAYPAPHLEAAPWEEEPEVPELALFASALERSLRGRHVAFPVRLSVSRHRRHVLVVGPQLAGGMERESFYSCSAELPWGRYGSLLADLGEASVKAVAMALLGSFRAREAAPAEPFRGPLVLGPGAAAVLLHEAVAHALEADTLAVGGRPDAAVGARIGAEGLSVLDDPTAAPEGARRTTDDEGVATGRRWLLRDGVVEQPLADGLWASRSEALAPGAARRGSRHLPPAPRSHHLEVLPGEEDDEALLEAASGGLWAPEASRGSLDELTGAFELHLPFARRLRGGEIAEAVGPCRLRGRVAEMLGKVAGIGREARPAGAGWCAKGGHKLPVWATTPPLRLDDVEVTP